MSGGLSSVQLACPHCGKLQRLVADEIPSTQMVTCSNCRTVLGNWRDLVAAQGPPKSS
jgi:hypothetical protein